MHITDTLRFQARKAARHAYLTDSYGNGHYDWQSAEVAACSILQKAGFPNDEAYELGREIASEVVNELEEGPTEEP